GMFVRQLLGGLALVLVISRMAAAAADERPPAPPGSEKAVAAIRNQFPNAVIDEVAEPKGFGGSGGKGTPMFWRIRCHVGETKHELSVLPEGPTMRLPSPVAVKDLPKPVAEAVAKAQPGATVRSAEKNEVRATLKYVALDKPHALQYEIDVIRDK